MKRKIFSVLFTLALVVGLTLMLATPVMAADGSGTCTVDPTSVTAGSTENTFTFTFTATEGMNTGEITIEAPAGWSAPQGTIGTAGYTTATSTGTIGTPTFLGQVVTVPLTTIAIDDTVTVVYGDGGGISGATAQTAVGTATFATMSKLATAGTLTAIGTSPTVTVNPGPASQLVFTTQPDGSVSGVALTTPPIVEAQDQYGNKDTSYTADVVAAEDDAGTLTGTTTKAAVAGVADFAGLGLLYTATADGETFEIDVTSGTLTAATSNTVTSDVVATKLVFTVQPAGSVSGVALTTQPVVQAQNAVGLLDEDYVTNVVAATDEAGTLSGTTTQTPLAGVATFTDLLYTATADSQTFQIDFTSAGITAATSSDVVCDVIATKLVFTTQPSASVSGVSLVQPVIEAQDAGNVLDADYVTGVVAAEDDAGTLTGTTTQTPLAGVATFTDLIYTATADGETFEIDVASGTLTAATSSTVTSDVVATKLVIATQPTGAMSAVALVVQPVINAVDATGTLDTDWVTLCSVAKTTGAGALVGTAINPMVLGVAAFTDVKITETAPDVRDSYTLTFSSGALTDVVSSAFSVYDKVLDLNDSAWTLISTDDYIVSSGTGTSVFAGSISLKYKYTGSSYSQVLTIEELTPVEAIYVKATSTDGWVGLNYSTAVSPGASIKALVAGWNLVSAASVTDAGAVLSPLQYVQIGTVQGVGLTTLVSQGTYNLSAVNWYIDATTWSNVTGNMNPFDGYWVYMNAAKSFGVIPQ